MDIQEIRKSNLHRLLLEAGTWAEVARLVNTDAKYLSQIVGKSGTRGVGHNLARRLEDAFHKPRGWMDHDHSEDHSVKESKIPYLVTHPAKAVLPWDKENPPPSDTFVMIPRLDVKLSAGNGTVIYEIDEKDPLPFQAEWLTRRGLKPKNIVLMYAHGDSMEDRIMDGDIVLIDIGDTKVVDNEIYAIRYGDELRLKRLFKRPDGGLRIVSDNKQYPEEVISPSEMEFINIVGKFVWRGG